MSLSTSIKHAICEAMNKQVAFSWVNDHSVQAGVYLTWSQETFLLIK